MARRLTVVGAPGIGVGVISLGLACCAVEVDAAIEAGLLRPDDSDGPVDVVIVAGTVTTPLIPVMEQAVRAAAPARGVLAFGACASTGGPYWDAPTVLNGADLVVPVSRYVPGCPPRPDALIEALLGMVEP